MKSILPVCCIIAGLLVAGCAKPAARDEFRAVEAKCLQCYIASNAVTAEAALLECARCAQQCQEAGVEGIPYDEVFAQTYGRLYLVERHLGHDAEAEQYLEKYARFHGMASSLARRTGRPHGEMERLIAQKFDSSLQVAWKSEPGANATGKAP